jgi:hypothetical protein
MRSQPSVQVLALPNMTLAFRTRESHHARETLIVIQISVVVMQAHSTFLLPFHLLKPEVADNPC